MSFLTLRSPRCLHGAVEMVTPRIVDTGCVMDPDAAAVAFSPAAGMLTVRARLWLSAWSDDEQLISSRHQPSTNPPMIWESQRNDARRLRIPMVPSTIRKTIDHPGQEDAVRAPGKPAAGVALAASAALLMSSVT